MSWVSNYISSEQKWQSVNFNDAKNGIWMVQMTDLLTGKTCGRNFDIFSIADRGGVGDQ